MVGAMHGTGGVQQGVMHAADTMRYGQCAGSTHPTGMHSYLFN